MNYSTTRKEIPMEDHPNLPSDGDDHARTEATRQPVNTRFDLLCPTALTAWAEVCHEGVVKYGERNWEKGLPGAKNGLNHALRHLMMHMKGDRSEPHLAKAIWNIAAEIHFTENCKHGTKA